MGAINLCDGVEEHALADHNYRRIRLAVFQVM